jgi:hypothetical protein
MWSIFPRIVPVQPQKCTTNCLLKPFHGLGSCQWCGGMYYLCLHWNTTWAGMWLQYTQCPIGICPKHGRAYSHTNCVSFVLPLQFNIPDFTQASQTTNFQCLGRPHTFWKHFLTHDRAYCTVLAGCCCCLMADLEFIPLVFWYPNTVLVTQGGDLYPLLCSPDCILWSSCGWRFWCSGGVLRDSRGCVEPEVCDCLFSGFLCHVVF